MNIIPYPFKKPRIEDDKLIAAYKKYKSFNATAKKLKMDHTAVRSRFIKLGLHQPRKFTKTFKRTKEINHSQPLNENRIIPSKIQPRHTKTYKDYLLKAIKNKKLPEYYAFFKTLK